MFIMSYFNEDIQECEEHCDICTSNVDTIQDCTSIALLVIQGLERLQQVQEKVTVLLLTQFLMGSPTIVLKPRRTPCDICVTLSWATSIFVDFLSILEFFAPRPSVV
jgi:hypothetical protein